MRSISESTRSFICTVAGWPQMATLTTRPPGRTAPIADASTASMPAHSNATSAPAPPVRSRTASPTSVSVGSSTTSAPAIAAFAFRAAAGSTEMICPAPVAFSEATVTSPIGPAPYTTAVPPGFRPESRTAW